ncbi:MAG: hypothetical protein AB8B69_01720 [Chitinophagales bacterium]
MNYKLFFPLFLLISLDFSHAQTLELPKNAIAGKCYKQCIGQERYETISQEVLVKEAYKKLIPHPAEYDTIQQKVLEQEGYIVFEVVPAEFTTAEVEVVIEPAYTDYSFVPPVFETQEEYVILEPARYQWKRNMSDAACFEQREIEDCIVWCWEITPPRLDTLYEEVVKTHARPIEKNMPPIVQTITKTMVLTPASLKRAVIPSTYRTIDVIKMVKPAYTEEVEVPAEYATISVRKRVEKAGLADWVEVDCEQIGYVEE